MGDMDRCFDAFTRLYVRDVWRGFKVDVIAYIVVNAVLVLINLLLTPGVLWFQWPLIGWGIGVASHYYFAVRKAPDYVRGLLKEAGC